MTLSAARIVACYWCPCEEEPLTVSYDRLGRVAVITIDRPERRNAVDSTTADLLHDAFVDFETDSEVDVAILTGAGGHFSSGADLKTFDLVDTAEGPLGFTRMKVSKPTLAAIEGYCVAGGLEMAMWCDLRIAGAGAVFGFFERRFGVPLIDGGTQRLPRLVGAGMAMELILTGRRVEADEAHAIGLVNAVTADGDALGVALEWAGRISQFPQLTVRTDRMALLDGLGLSLVDGLARERDYGLRVMDQARKGAARFAAGSGRGGRMVGWLAPVPDTEFEEIEEAPADQEPTPTAPQPEPSEAWANVAVRPGIDLEAVELVWGLPPAASAPGVLVIPERGVIDDDVRLFVERLSNSGFLTLAAEIPDPRTHAPSQVGLAVDAAIARLLKHPVARSDEVGLIGYGIGGGVAMWYATVDDRVAGVVSYSGSMPNSDYNPRYEESRAAYLGHYAGADATVSPQYAYELEMALRDKSIDATFNIYPRAGEDELRLVEGDVPPDADRAFRRTVSFLTRTL